MLYVNMLYMLNLNLFRVQSKNQDDSCSLTSSNAENKLYHRKGMRHSESLKID